MSKTFLLTSTLWAGEVELRYDEMGYLTHFDLNRSEMTKEQHISFLQWLPRTKDELDYIIKKATHLTLSDFVQEVTFEMFWDRYNEKVRSSKKKTLRIWERLSMNNRVRAYNHISRYENNINPGVAKKYAETYLNAELWNN